VDPKSRGAADLLRALMGAAARFSETGGSLTREYFPHVGCEPISDLAGPAVRLGMRVTLPGHELVAELAVRVTDAGFTIGGELMLDDAEPFLTLPPIETADVDKCAALLHRYAEELTVPARLEVGRLLEHGC
jgi:hypothetical protein